MLARATRPTPPDILSEDLSMTFPIQSKHSITAAAAAAPSNSSRTRSPPVVRGSSSALASATAAAAGVDPFPLISLMRTLRRRDADWPPAVCELIGKLPLDKPPTLEDRHVLVDALVDAFPDAAKRMATVSRVCKQQARMGILPSQLCVLLKCKLADWESWRSGKRIPGEEAVEAMTRWLSMLELRCVPQALPAVLFCNNLNRYGSAGSGVVGDKGAVRKSKSLTVRMKPAPGERGKAARALQAPGPSPSAVIVV